MHALARRKLTLTHLGQPQARDVGLGVEGRVVHGEQGAHAHRTAATQLHALRRGDDAQPVAAVGRQAVHSQ